MQTDEAELEAARRREREERAQRNAIIAGVLGTLVLAGLAAGVHAISASASERQHDAKLSAIAASVSAQQARWNAEHRNGSAVDDTLNDADLTGDVGPPIDADEAGRALIAKLVANPIAIKPTTISPPDNVEPHTTYEYKTTELGDVIQWRTDAKRWSIFLAGRDRPEIFAPRSALRLVERVGQLITWWRITDGPFRGAFVMLSQGAGIELRSQSGVCDHGATRIPGVDQECGL